MMVNETPLIDMADAMALATLLALMAGLEDEDAAPPQLPAASGPDVNDIPRTEATSGPVSG